MSHAESIPQTGEGIQEMKGMQSATQLIKNLDEAERKELLMVENMPDIKVFLGNLSANRFVTPLEDKDVPEQFRAHIPKYRVIAGRHNWSGVVAYSVRAGFHFKNGPKLGPCYDDWKYLRDWRIKEGDEPTLSALVFWVPRLLEGSTGKNVEVQKGFLAELRAELQLPKHHLSGFGSVSLLAPLIQLHAKRTGERTPLNGYVVRTDSVRTDGNRLILQWSGESLYCAYWCFDGYRDGYLGCFALGVEALES